MATVSESAIWERIIRPERGDLSKDAARFFLGLTFEPHDLRRMHVLAEKNQADELSADELEELRCFRQVGLQLDLFRSKARLALRASDS